MILYFKRIIKDRIKQKQIDKEKIEIILEKLIDTIIYGIFSENCLSNISNCFFDILNYEIIREEGLFLFYYIKFFLIIYI
jgi:hypothetical protein